MRKAILVVIFLVFVFSSGSSIADCPSADLTGDCFVDFEDFALVANMWLQEGVMPYSNLRREHIAAMESEMSTSNIDASDGNEFMPGTYFVYKTDEGRFGKFMVENYEPAGSYDMVLRWVTYNADGSVYSHGTRLIIRGTWTCDLDEGLETATGKDWSWVLQSSTVRRLFPHNGAKFKLMHRTIAPAGMVWVYIDEWAVSGYEGYMSKYETTNAQYCQFLNAALASGDIYVSGNIVYGSNGSNAGTDFVDQVYFETYAADSDSQITYSGGTFSVRTRDGYDMSNHPVVEVSWYGAMAFASYYGWRLPTEWEWQAVADYDGSYTYGCGTSIDHSKANYDDTNPLGLSSFPYTSPVGHYPAYGYGINDMAGNVWEWTWLIYMGSHRVVRGGSWGDHDTSCTVSYGNYRHPDGTHCSLGFRVCR